MGSASADHGMGEKLVTAGTLVGAFGVAVTMLPGGYDPFGPVKLTVLLTACALIAVGFTANPTLLTAALRRAVAQRGVWPALALVGLAGLSTITSVDASQSLTGHYPEYQGLALLLASAWLGLAGYSLADDGGRLWSLTGRAATVVLLLVGAYALAQFVGLDPVAAERVLLVRRVRATLGNASNLGVYLCLAVPFAVASARAERGAWRTAAWLAVTSGGVALATALSRGAWAGAAACAITWLVLEARDLTRARRVRLAAVATGVAVAAVALTALLVPNAATRLGATLRTDSGTVAWRLAVWSQATRLAAERPLLGFGPASFRYAFPPRRSAATQAGETGVQVLDDPHNLFVSAATSAGALAALALAWLLGEAVLAAARTRGRAWPHAGPALAAVIVGGAVALQFHFATLDTASLLALAIALALGAPTPAGAAAARTASDRATSAARIAAATLACGLVALALLSAGLVIADRHVAAAFAAVGAGRPWDDARRELLIARQLAPWEPAMSWARGRVATLAAARGDSSAVAGGAEGFGEAVARLPLDPLLAAQHGELYVAAGVASRDTSFLATALPLTERAVDLDPENGYRWSAKATALAGLGDNAGAVAAFERAVRYAPDNVQAWSSLAQLYERLGRSEDAAKAKARAAELDAAQGR